MECIDIEKLYNKESRNVTINAEIPFNVYKLLLSLVDEGYFQGLNGLSLEEVTGTQIIAGICTTVPKEKWEKIIPVSK